MGEVMGAGVKVYCGKDEEWQWEWQWEWERYGLNTSEKCTRQPRDLFRTVSQEYQGTSR